MDYFASPIPDRSKPHCLRSSMKFWEKISSEWKGIMCQNIQRVLKNKFQSTSNNENNIETHKLKLKQQRISLKCLMTENSSLTIN